MRTLLRPVARRLRACRRGATAVEFAMVMPPFLCLLFLMVDGGRLLFWQQSLNELAGATARCAAIRTAGKCADVAATRNWAVSRAATISQLSLTPSMVAVTQATRCNAVANMAQVTITIPYKRTALRMLGSTANTSLVATACFPMQA